MYERKRAIHQYIQDMKNQLYCVDCGQQHPATLHFHHLNSEKKVFDISYAANRGFSLDKIKKEIEKCVVLCANCHAIRHYNMRSKQHISPGIAGQVDKMDLRLATNPEEAFSDQCDIYHTGH